MAALFAQDHIVKTDAVALRVDMQFAHGIGLVTGLAKGLRQSRQVRIHLEVFIEDPVAVAPRRGAGHQGAARRDAGGRGGIGLGEEHAVVGQAVEGGGENVRMPHGPHQGTGKVVGADQQDIGF